MKNRIITMLTVIVSVVLLSAEIGNAQSIEFNISSTTAKRGDTLLLPLNVNTLNEGHGVISGQIAFEYNTSVIAIYGIQTSGTVLQNTLEIQYNIANKKLAFSDTGEITGSGVFAYLRIRVLSNPSPLNDSVKIQSIMLNEGMPTAVWTNGYMRVLDMHISPKNPPTNLIVGDSLQFIVTGDNQLPLTWASSDPAVATVDANGKMMAIGVGQLKIYVEDSQGLKDSTELFGINSPLLRSLTISLPDTSYRQTLQFAMPVYITDVTPLGLISARFSLTYNAIHLQATDVVSGGTLSEDWSVPAFSVTSGRIDVALAGTEPLTDSGVLVYVIFRVGATATGYTDLNFSNVLFNEDVNANTESGRFTVIPAPTLVIVPISTTLAKGDSMLFRVTSGGTPPYVWSSSVPTVGTLHPASGWFTALERGTTTVAVVDSFGFTRTTGLITVEDIRARLPDTSIIVLGDSVDVPITFFGAPGLGVISFETRLKYNSSILQLTTVYGEGTLSESFNITYRDTLDTVRIAAAGTSPVSGNGELLVLRFKTAPGALIGQNTIVQFTQFLLNEPGSNTPTVRTHNGRIFVGVSEPSQYLEFTPALFSFGNVLVGESMSLAVQTKNLAIEAMSINSVFSSEPEFSIAPELGWLEPNDSAPFTISFTPSSTGIKNAFIIFTHNADGSPDSLLVSGTGIAPAISVTPAFLDFKSVQLGNSKMDRIILTNTGTADLSISTVQTDNADFSILPLSALIAPLQSDTFYITFTPSGTGVSSGEISLTHTASGSPLIVPVSGTGVSSSFTVERGSIAFGDVLLGGNTVDSVTVYNIGSLELNIFNTRTDNGSFLVNPGNATIPPYDSMQFYVTFSANSYGAQSGSVIFDHSANGTPDSVILSGRCLAPIFSLSATSINFQNVVYGSIKTDSFIVTNTGTADLDINNIQSNTDDYFATPVTAVLQPLKSQTFVVTFVPSSIGSIEGVLSFHHNASSSPDSFFLTGAGIYGIVNVPISHRWNLLSLPVIPLNDSLAQIFSGVAQPFAFSYDGTSYVEQETMQQGMGYWAKFSAPETVEVQGYPFRSDTIPVHKGWNLIGALSEPLSVLAIDPVGTEFASLLWEYRSRYNEIDTLYPGNGYWVKVSKAGGLVLNPSSLKQRSAPHVSETNPVEILNRLTIVSATGEEAVLYYGEPSISLLPDWVWSLPPIPPSGIFDARYATGTFAEFSSEEQDTNIPIFLSSEQYPLTIRWQTIRTASQQASLKINDKEIGLTGSGEITVEELQSPVLLLLGKQLLTPGEFALLQNYPNPFNPSTVFNYQLPVSSYVTLNIYNILGEEVAEVINEMQDAGFKTLSWNANGMSSGIYFYKIKAGAYTDIKKLILMK